MTINAGCQYGLKRFIEIFARWIWEGLCCAELMEMEWRIRRGKVCRSHPFCASLLLTRYELTARIAAWNGMIESS